jgi:hypothetical protein
MDALFHNHNGELLALKLMEGSGSTLPRRHAQPGALRHQPCAAMVLAAGAGTTAGARRWRGLLGAATYASAWPISGRPFRPSPQRTPPAWRTPGTALCTGVTRNHHRRTTGDGWNTITRKSRPARDTCRSPKPCSGEQQSSGKCHDASPQPLLPRRHRRLQ